LKIDGKYIEVNPIKNLYTFFIRFRYVFFSYIKRIKNV